MPKLGCLVAGEEHGSRRTFCETLKHGCPEVERLNFQNR
jgi:hypothetical protein